MKHVIKLTNVFDNSWEPEVSVTVSVTWIKIEVSESDRAEGPQTRMNHKHSSWSPFSP